MAMTMCVKLSVKLLVFLVITTLLYHDVDAASKPVTRKGRRRLTVATLRPTRPTPPPAPPTTPRTPDIYQTQHQTSTEPDDTLNVVFLAATPVAIHSDDNTDSHNAADEWALTRDFCRELVLSMQTFEDTRRRFALISVGDVAEVEFGLTDYMDNEAVKKAISELGYKPLEGQADMSGALQLLQSVVKSSGSVHTMAVIITDAVDEVPDAEAELVESLQSLGIHLVLVAVTHTLHGPAQLTRWRQLVAENDIFSVADYNELDQIEPQVSDKLLERHDHEHEEDEEQHETVVPPTTKRTVHQRKTTQRPKKTKHGHSMQTTPAAKKTKRPRRVKPTVPTTTTTTRLAPQSTDSPTPAAPIETEEILIEEEPAQSSSVQTTTKTTTEATIAEETTTPGDVRDDVIEVVVDADTDDAGVKAEAVDALNAVESATIASPDGEQFRLGVGQLRENAEKINEDDQSALSGFEPQNECPGAGPIDLALVIDLSSAGSVELSVNFVKTLVQSLEVGPRGAHVAIVTYYDRANVVHYFDEQQTKDSLVKVVENMRTDHGKHADLNSALRLLQTDIFASDSGHRRGVPRAALIVSHSKDDVPEENSLLTVRAARRCTAAGITVAGVHLGDASTGIRLRQLVSNQVTDYLRGAAASSLSRLVQRVVTRLSCVKGNSRSTSEEEGEIGEARETEEESRAAMIEEDVEEQEDEEDSVELDTTRELRLTVFTGCESRSGTRGNVTATIFDADYHESFVLVPPRGHSFARDSIHTFTLTVPHKLNNPEISFSHDDTSSRRGWNLWKAVMVDDETNEYFALTCNCWVKSDAEQTPLVFNKVDAKKARAMKQESCGDLEQSPDKKD